MNNLKEFIKQEKLELPNYNELNLINLVQTIYLRFGYKTTENDNIKYIDELIPHNKHYLFVVSDGTGVNLFKKLKKGSILKDNLKCDLLTVFPTTTGCVLTSIVTAKYPECHGIWGWYSYNRELNRDFHPLLFSDRKSEKSLSEFNILPEDIFKEESVLNKLNVKVDVLYPDFICNSIYSKFVVADNLRRPYSNYNDIENAIKEICKDDIPSYTYLYMPDVDSIEHKNGIDSKVTIDKLNEIDEMIKNIAKNKDLTIVLTADHGQNNVYEDLILDFEKYDKYFYAYPSIDYGTASYYVKKEYEDEFIEAFNEDFKNKMFLFKTEEFLKNNMFGVGDISDFAKNNLGEYISLCKTGAYLINTKNVEKYYGKIKGNHSGLTSDEMRIPLVIIDTNSYNNES